MYSAGFPPSTQRNYDVGVSDASRPPPLPAHNLGEFNHREFSRWDYSHNLGAPRLVPFVREYEHGLGNARDIPVINTSIPPPPIILNSVAHNPYLLDNFRRQAVFGHSISQSNLPVFVDQGCPRAPCPPGWFSDPPTSITTTPVVSNDSLILQQVRAELAQAKADIRDIVLGKQGGEGAAINPPDILPEDVQEIDNTSDYEGTP